MAHFLCKDLGIFVLFCFGGFIFAVGCMFCFVLLFCLCKKLIKDFRKFNGETPLRIFIPISGGKLLKARFFRIMVSSDTSVTVSMLL